MHFLLSKASSPRVKLHAAAVSVAMLAACGGGSDNGTPFFPASLPLRRHNPETRHPHRRLSRLKRHATT